MTSSRALRVAILGAGMIGEVHRRAARLAGAELVGVLASTPERSRTVAAAWGVERAYADLDEVAASGVDAVHICTPNASHVPYAVQLMEAGKHVLCEKPLGISLDDAKHAAAVAERTGMVNTMPFAYRFHPMVREMRARVQSEEFGDVNLMHGSYLQDWLLDPRATSWRVDASAGGPSRAFGDIGSHWCDLVEWVTGHRISELTAAVQTVLPERAGPAAGTFARADGDGEGAAQAVAVTTEDAVQVLFRTDRGAAGSLVVSQVSPGRKNRLWFEVDGAAAGLAFDQENPETLHIGRRTGTSMLPRDPALLSPEAARISPLPAGHPMGYHDCFAGFVADVYQAIADGRPSAVPRYPTFSDAASTARLTEAVLRSARTRSWIEVS